MQLDKISEIKETHKDQEVNEFLSKGFRLIKILSSKSVANEIDEVRPVYVLGLIKD